MIVDKMIELYFTVPLKLKQCFQKFIAKDETQTKPLDKKPLDKKAITEEEERYIQHCISTKLYMDDLFDKLVIRLKEVEKTIKLAKSLVESSMMYRNKNLIYLDAFNEDEPFQWYNEYKKGMPLDCTFKLCKGTLSTFKGYKGLIGELTDCSDEAVEGRPRNYDVIRFKAEPLAPWPDGDDTDKLYIYARWYLLAYYTYNLLYVLTFANLHLLDWTTYLEVGLCRPTETCRFCKRELSNLCKVNEHSILLSITNFWERFTRVKKEWNRELTILEYRKVALQL